MSQMLAFTFLYPKHYISGVTDTHPTGRAWLSMRNYFLSLNIMFKVIKQFMN